MPKYSILAYGGVIPPIARFTPIIEAKWIGSTPILVTRGKSRSTDQHAHGIADHANEEEEYVYEQ